MTEEVRISRVGTATFARQRKKELAVGEISFLPFMYFTCQYLATLVPALSQGSCTRNMGTWRVSERESVANFVNMTKATTVVCFCLYNAARH